MKTQCQMLLDYLTRHGSVTPAEAWVALGIARLGARVWDLKRQGFGIVTTMVDVPTRFGTTARVARYSLGTEQSQSPSGVFTPVEAPPTMELLAGAYRS